jgi:putative heme-binding domain-containing protein
MRNIGGSDAVKLMEFWSQEKLNYTADDWETQLRTWQSWFQQKWPEQSPIVAGQTQKTGRYSVDELLSYIDENGLGDAQRGRHFFTSAQCAACHQLGSAGQNVGPDLTSLGFRFSLRETLEATIQPSKTIPDRYQSKIVLTVDGQQFSGMAVSQSDGGFVILQSNGKRVRIAGDDVEEVKTSSLSAMPEGLLDQLSPAEIADLMAFIMQAQPAENQSAKSSTTTQTR